MCASPEENRKEIEADYKVDFWQPLEARKKEAAGQL